ncbi:hypothetical protein PAESOLCIP111_04108 [Paenibacillus solanacearum]|uniref:Extracellular solute-binding protein n=1 Tax=Paenibacillus solanacearum TaxID=2048548 RepID=A0A916K3Q7_9BACL|nr:extracellular solute-binding protein [Paenibacillus solanacearum]CAG7640163.1 hypothetical protein PAESOLCIP111_04108 [Paenibacillus solanacearum]
MMKKKYAIAWLGALTLMTACSGKQMSTAPEDLGEPSPGGPKNVVIAVQRSDRFLEMAVEKFEALHPDIHIEIKPYMAVPDTGGNMMAAVTQADIEKYVQTVTTEVISGKGADLIAMNSLPQSKFVEKKLLANMNDWIAKDASFDRSKYYEHILQASRNGDGLYSMPFSFALEMMQGNTDQLKKANLTIEDTAWTWEQFKEIAGQLKRQEGPDYVGIINLFPNQLIADFICSNYSKLVQQGRAQFDSELFRGMMRQVKAMYDEGILRAEFSYDYSKSLFKMSSLANAEQILTMPSNAQLFLKPTVEGQSQGASFYTYFNLAINSKSKVQQEAWMFIKFLLSDEIQASPELSGLPINKATALQKFDQVKQNIENGKLQLPKDKPDAHMTEERIRTVQKLIEGVSTKQYIDTKVLMMAMAEFESYMSGQKSAEEVSRLIQNKVTTYLNE